MAPGRRIVRAVAPLQPCSPRIPPRCLLSLYLALEGERLRLRILLQRLDRTAAVALFRQSSQRAPVAEHLTNRTHTFRMSVWLESRGQGNWDAPRLRSF